MACFSIVLNICTNARTTAAFFEIRVALVFTMNGSLSAVLSIASAASSF